MTLVAVLGSLLLVALAECCRPRRRCEFPALRRRFGNLGIWLLDLVLMAFYLDSPATFRSQLETVSGLVLPAWPIADVGLSFVLGFLLLDLMRYAVHRCKHAVPFLWRLHALHHSDPDVDVTTSVRQHPIDYLLGSTVHWLMVVALGIPATVWLAYGVALFASEALQHGNIRLPEWLERWLQPLFVTTDMHRIHHSVACDQANANYGAVFSVWDRSFRTFTSMSRARHETIVFGVRELPPGDCLKPSAMMLTPWRLGTARPAGSGN